MFPNLFGSTSGKYISQQWDYSAYPCTPTHWVHGIGVA